VAALSGQLGFRAVEHPDTCIGVFDDADFQLSLWMLYELHYRGFDGVEDQEWDPDAIRLRRHLESGFEGALVRQTAAQLRFALHASDDLAEQIAVLVDAFDGPNLAAFLQREATLEQVREFLAQRSLYHLKESDPHAFVVPRIDGPAKTALAELQYDEYGAGRPARLHAKLFSDALAGAGLDNRYGAYVDLVPASSLAVNNVMSLFGLNRRLRGAALGHLAAFESTSAVPCRRIAAGIERVGLPDVVAEYFHEHVEADSAHEHVAIRDICGAFLEAEPDQLPQVLFGVAACLYLDVVAAERLLGDWQRGDEPLPEGVAS
jgi:hypothetical protein